MKPAKLSARLAAAIIDLVIVSVVTWIVSIPFMKIFKFDQASKQLQDQMQQMQTDPMSGVSPDLMQMLMSLLIGLFILIIVSALIIHIYFVYFETKTGETLGKRALGIRVVNLDGGPITRNQAVYREIVRWYVDGLFVFPFFISILTTERKQRVGDVLAKTMVIEVPRP